MTSLISIRMSEELLQATKENAARTHLTQTQYIRQAIEKMNKEIEKRERELQLTKASLKTRKDSLRISNEFSNIERDIDDE